LTVKAGGGTAPIGFVLNVNVLTDVLDSTAALVNVKYGVDGEAGPVAGAKLSGPVMVMVTTVPVVETATIAAVSVAGTVSESRFVAEVNVTATAGDSRSSSGSRLSR
jgi:hypothetical protein